MKRLRATTLTAIAGVGLVSGCCNMGHGEILGRLGFGRHSAVETMDAGPACEGPVLEDPGSCVTGPPALPGPGTTVVPPAAIPTAPPPFPLAPPPMPQAQPQPAQPTSRAKGGGM